MSADELFEKLSDADVYYELRRFGVTRVNQHTVQLVKYIIVLHFSGLPITADALAFLTKTNPTNCLNFLHRLGDFGLLELIPGDKYRYKLDANFAERFHPDKLLRKNTISSQQTLNTRSR